MKFNSNNILLDVNASNQKAVLELIASKAIKAGLARDVNALTNDFLEREKEFSTGFGNGVAIPHAKTDDVLEPSIFFVRLANEVDWNAMDGKPVKLIIGIIVPIVASKEHLDTLAKLSRKIIHTDFIDQLNTDNKEEITDLITKTIS